MNRFIKSFGYAITGWKSFFKTEKNGRIQAFLGMVAIVAGFLLHLHSTEWIIILFCIGLVLAFEMMNSVIEKMIDHIHPHRHEQVKWIKDVSAGAVLITAVISAIIAGIIFIPKIITLL